MNPLYVLARLINLGRIATATPNGVEPSKTQRKAEAARERADQLAFEDPVTQFISKWGLRVLIVVGTLVAISMVGGLVHTIYTHPWYEQQRALDEWHRRGW